MPDYATLSKVQKIAIFLVTIGPEAAAEVMRSFENAQLELICREIAALPLVDPALQQEALKEFAGVVAGGMGATLGGVAYVQNTLERAKGDYAATAILNRCALPSHTEASEEIRQMEGQQLLNLMKTERPQTMAFVLSYMDTPKAAEIVSMLTPEVREEVVERLGTMEPTSLDSIAKVAKNLNRRFDKRAMQQSLHRADGVKACADILNALEKELRKSLLSRIEDRNAALGAAIRKKVFSFEELSRLTPGDLQRVLREVDSADLPLALKTSKPPLVDAVLGALSKRASEALKEEIEILGAPRAKDVDAAQGRIIQVVRRLEEEEEITLDSATDERAFA